ncbi:uncharacterized protein [Montipora foliosa]|uniref:uncharacterized protein n=1 Tax=Montipora foliosa TaxID=591990 RepID=UPI0035F19C2F
MLTTQATSLLWYKESKMIPMIFFVTLLLTRSTTKTEGQLTQQGIFFEVTEDHCCLHDEDIWSGEVESLMLCSQMCAWREACKSAVYMIEQGTCSLTGKSQTENPDWFHGMKGCVYLEKVVRGVSPSPSQPGQSAVLSCQCLCNQASCHPSGVYLIDPDGGSQANTFTAYCDMETDGGGWTLVWSYKFTNYENFTHESNAVTPRPSWPANSEVNVPISTTPPQNETDYNAVNFSVWKQLGRQILIKSNINNWLVCDPGKGSLVDWQEGSVNCHFIKNVTKKCTGTPGPVHVATSSSNNFYGPMYTNPNQKGGIFFYFDGSTLAGHNWPTHDPCGTNTGNHLDNVANPHGSIFIR